MDWLAFISARVGIRAEFPVFFPVTRKIGISETSSLVTASSSGESGANSTSRFGDVAGELRRIDSDRPAQEATLNALHSDLVIVGHPEPNGLLNDLTLERILLASGVPLLVLPNAWLGEEIGNNVLIGWNASLKARRTISDAMPFLVDARAVTTARNSLGAEL